MNMYKLTFVAKLFSQAMGGQVSISYAQKDIALEALKETARNRQDWIREEKEFYHLMVDYGKDLLRQNDRK